IRDRNVTGVQTCALPICTVQEHHAAGALEVAGIGTPAFSIVVVGGGWIDALRRRGIVLHRRRRRISRLDTTGREGQQRDRGQARSEERRVGKERGSWRWS